MSKVKIVGSIVTILAGVACIFGVFHLIVAVFGILLVVGGVYELLQEWKERSSKKEVDEMCPVLGKEKNEVENSTRGQKWELLVSELGKPVYDTKSYSRDTELNLPDLGAVVTLRVIYNFPDVRRSFITKLGGDTVVGIPDCLDYLIPILEGRIQDNNQLKSINESISNTEKTLHNLSVELALLKKIKSSFEGKTEKHKEKTSGKK